MSSLGNCSITDYLLYVQNLVNELTSIGESMSSFEHLNMILDGLLDEYDSSISVISTRFDPLSIDEVGTILLEHESHIERSHKRTLGSINLIEGTSGSSSLENSSTPNSAQIANPNSQVQVNLTSRTSSGGNSTGNRFFDGHGG